jgi:hypothetical protein
MRAAISSKRVNVNHSNPDPWWAERSGAEKSFLQAVILLAEDVQDGEVLELRFDGQGFTPLLISKHVPTTQPRLARTRIRPNQQDDEWWAALSFGQRVFVRELAGIIKDVRHDGDKSLEIKHTDQNLAATLVFNFKKPMTGGRPETN